MKNLVLTFCALGAFAAVAFAQQDKSAPMPIDRPDKMLAPLNMKQLKELLTNLGLDPTQNNDSSFVVDMRRPQYTIKTTVSFSPNGKYIWLSAYLSDLPDDVAANRLRAILEAINVKTGKMQFRLVKQKLLADQPVDNRRVDPARMRQELDSFATSVEATDTIWNPKLWK